MTDDLAARLLDAQIAHARRELLDPSLFEPIVADEVEHTLAEASRLTLDDVVTRQLIKDTAYKYAVQMPLEGSIPELVGEIAGRIYRHPANEQFRVSDILGADRFDELASAVADMAATRRLVRDILTSPLTLDLCAEVVTNAVEGTVADARHAGTGPGTAITATLARAAQPLLPTIESGLARLTRAGAGFVLRSASADADAALLDSARTIWQQRADERVGWFREVVDADDVEDAVVIAVQFWKSFRDTDYFRALLDEGIDHVFDKYGDTSLTELLADLGIGRDDLIEEGMRFGPPVLAELDARGVLESILRRRFAPFYSSPEFLAALEGAIDGPGVDRPAP